MCHEKLQEFYSCCFKLSIEVPPVILSFQLMRKRKNHWDFTPSFSLSLSLSLRIGFLFPFAYHFLYECLQLFECAVFFPLWEIRLTLAISIVLALYNVKNKLPKWTMTMGTNKVCFTAIWKITISWLSFQLKKKVTGWTLWNIIELEMWFHQALKYSNWYHS